MFWVHRAPVAVGLGWVKHVRNMLRPGRYLILSCDSSAMQCRAMQCYAVLIKFIQELLAKLRKTRIISYRNSEISDPVHPEARWQSWSRPRGSFSGAKVAALSVPWRVELVWRVIARPPGEVDLLRHRLVTMSVYCVYSHIYIYIHIYINNICAYIICSITIHV